MSALAAGDRSLINLNNLTLHEREYLRIKSILAMTQKDLRADLVLLIDRNGQQIAFEGPATGIDLTALASLAAANLAATDGLARLVGEPEFSILYHQGQHRSIHISDVAKRFSLALVFDETVSLGMVRLRVKRATAYLEELLRGFARKTDGPVGVTKESSPTKSPFDFSDDDIEMLFKVMKPKTKNA
jgi:predicted regulator of Ras-like GTPase activity (Roadblock/LC7/MglB family)